MEEDNAKPIRGVVEGLLEDWKKKKIFKKDIVEEVWRKIAGKKAAKHAKVSSIRAGRLIIEVDESGWIYQLTLKKQDILKKLNKSLNKKDIEITGIQFRIGSFK